MDAEEYLVMHVAAHGHAYLNGKRYTVADLAKSSHSIVAIDQLAKRGMLSVRYTRQHLQRIVAGIQPKGNAVAYMEKFNDENSDITCRITLEPQT